MDGNSCNVEGSFAVFTIRTFIQYQLEQGQKYKVKGPCNLFFVIKISFIRMVHFKSYGIPLSE